MAVVLVCIVHVCVHVVHHSQCAIDHNSSMLLVYKNIYAVSQKKCTNFEMV